MESGVIFGISFGLVWGLGTATRSANWRDFWNGFAILLLILFAFAIGALAIDTLFQPLPLGQYLVMWGIAVPLSTTLGVARRAFRR